MPYSLRNPPHSRIFVREARRACADPERLQTPRPDDGRVSGDADRGAPVRASNEPGMLPGAEPAEADDTADVARVGGESGDADGDSECGGERAEAPTGTPTDTDDDAVTADADTADAALELGDRIADLSARIAAAEYELLTLIAEFHRSRGWEVSGFPSCADWLAWRTSIRIGAARERVRTALALAHLPRTSQAMEAGTLSFTKVRALTRVATAESEEALLELARSCSAAEVERVVRAWKHLSAGEELSREEVRHRRRALSTFVDGDGMVVVRGRLEPEVGALLVRALDAAEDALFQRGVRVRRVDDVGESAGRDPDRLEPEQRRADALALLAERALAAGVTAAPVSGARAERYQVVVHVAEETLRTDGRHTVQSPSFARSEIDGTRVSAETSRRLACDGSIVRMTRAGAGSTPTTLDGDAPDPPRDAPDPPRDAPDPPRDAAGSPPALPDGQPACALPTRPIAHRRVAYGAAARGAVAHRPIVAVGRRSRTIPAAIRRALEARDRMCRFPGCGCRHTDAHHVRHWADGGETALTNLVLLCRRHHRAVHEGGWRVCIGRDQEVVFFNPRGQAVSGAPAGPDERMPPPLAPLRGPSDPLRLAPRWRRDRDVPWAIEAAAREALEDTSDSWDN